MVFRSLLCLSLLSGPLDLVVLHTAVLLVPLLALPIKGAASSLWLSRFLCTQQCCKKQLLRRFPGSYFALRLQIEIEKGKIRENRRAGVIAVDGGKALSKTALGNLKRICLHSPHSSFKHPPLTMQRLFANWSVSP